MLGLKIRLLVEVSQNTDLQLCKQDMFVTGGGSSCCIPTKQSRDAKSSIKQSTKTRSFGKKIGTTLKHQSSSHLYTQIYFPQ